MGGLLIIRLSFLKKSFLEALLGSLVEASSDCPSGGIV